MQFSGSEQLQLSSQLCSHSRAGDWGEQMKREEMGTHPIEISAFPPVLLRGLDPRDTNPEERSGFPSHVPNKRGVTAAAAPSGRFISKALGDLEEGETDCIMGLSATMQSLISLLSQHPTSSAPPILSVHKQPALQNSTGAALPFSAQLYLCHSGINAPINPAPAS